MKHRVACIIPARGGSKGIPRKNILEIAGKPLIAWSIEQARASHYVGDEVFVTSDSDEILEISKQFGARPIKRPERISRDSSSSEEALLHALGAIEESGPIDYVVFLQATSPVRAPDDIDNAMQQIVREESGSLLSARPVHDYFIWERDSDGCRSVTYDFSNRPRRQDIRTRYMENGSIYIFKPESLKKNNNRLGGKISIYEMDKIRSYQVDDEEDIQICSTLLKLTVMNGTR